MKWLVTKQENNQPPFSCSWKVGLLILWQTILGCATPPTPPPSPIKGDDFYSISDTLSHKNLDFNDLEKRGPFSAKIRRNFHIRVSKSEVINTDLYLSSHGGRAPLLIFQHGNLGDKDYHAFQAERVASWGMHALVLEQPNEHRWLKNGETLGELVQLLRKWPGMLDHKFDPENIILVGHSFGGSAIAVAAGKDAPIKGLIFLDPALYNKTVMYYIKKVKVPAILLGADTRVFKSRYRQMFYELFPRNIIEISIRGATHNDAQYPNQFFWAESLGIEATPSPVRQERFTAAIISSALSLSKAGDGSFAWKIFNREKQKGTLVLLHQKGMSDRSIRNDNSNNNSNRTNTNKTSINLRN